MLIHTKFAYDGDNLYLEFDGANTLTHRYLHGEAVDQILADENLTLPGGNVYWQAADHEGSVRKIARASDLTQMGQVNYSVYGAWTGSLPGDQQFTYTGREFDGGVGPHGLYYLRNRYQDPKLGRFLSQDPSGFASGDVNLYRYAENDPVRQTDPYGLQATGSLGFGSASISSYEVPTSRPNMPSAPSTPPVTSRYYAPGSPGRLQQLYEIADHYAATGNSYMVNAVAFQMEMEANPHRPPGLNLGPVNPGAAHSDPSNPFLAYAGSLAQSGGGALHSAGTGLYDLDTGAYALTTSTDAQAAFVPAWYATRVNPMADRLTAKAEFRNVQNPGYAHLSYSLLEDLTVARYAEAYHGGLLTGETFEDGLWDMGPRTQHLAYGVSDIAGAAATGLQFSGLKFNLTSTRTSATTATNFNIERSPGFHLREPFHPRSVDLPQSASMADIAANRWIPGVEGVTVTDGTVRFADIYKLTEGTGIEFGLTRELVGDQKVFRLYSGNRYSVQMNPGVGGRTIGHTHPSGSKMPGRIDMNNFNNAFIRSIEVNPLALVPHRRVIWGSGPADSTIYRPDILR